MLRAVRALGIDAQVNERNDICVGVEKASGSAYKIVSGRAYHHGTMLITTKLETLGDLLRVNKVRSDLSRLILDFYLLFIVGLFACDRIR